MASTGPARVARLLATFALLVCVVTLLGWWDHVRFLVGLYPDLATMKPNTAVAILLLALATLTRNASPRFAIVANLLTLMTLIITLTTLFEYASGRSLGVDQLLFRVPSEVAGDPAGRMSVGTAVDGAMLAIGLLLLDLLPILSTTLAAVSSVLSLTALTGFIFDAAPILGVPLLRSMAIRTAISFLALDAAYFCLRPRREPVRSLLHGMRHHPNGAWFIAATCLLPLAIGWPVAELYRHGEFEATFAFSLLVVLLIVAQTVLVSRNSRSIEKVERKREELERARKLLEAENEKQRTSLIASEKLAALNEAQFRLISDSLPAMVSYLDPQLCYVRVNKTYEDWFEIPAAQIEGRKIDGVLGISAENVRPYLGRALRGEPQRFETRLMTKQGERIVEITHIPDRAADGRIRGIIVHGTDLTARKREEAALRQTEKLAAVGKLASSIAHEINNPLESVTNLLYLAASSAETPEVRDYLRTAEEELKRVSTIASQTLRFHKQTTRPIEISATDLLQSVLGIYYPRLKGLVRLEERHRATRPIICLDGEIRQVLNNLVGNALDAMSGGAGRLLIRSHDATDWATGEKGVAFVVADTGIGMSDQTLAAIFEAFFTTKGMNGTGLGLWVSKEIIDRHTGRLQVRSAQRATQHGTVFRLFLPYHPFGLAGARRVT